LFYWKYHFNGRFSGIFTGYEKSFNPCFTGSTTSTTTAWPFFPAKPCFNPCFTGSTTSTTLDDTLIAELKFVQSLFYWKYHFNSMPSPLRLPSKRSFNPCFTGSTTSTLCLIPFSSHVVVFQSLFYWKYHFNAEGCRNKHQKIPGFQSLFYWKYHFNHIRRHSYCRAEIRFNPCFTGSTTSTYHTLSMLSIVISFQSLFYWKYHFNKNSPSEKDSGYLVSILVLLEVPLQPIIEFIS